MPQDPRFGSKNADTNGMREKLSTHTFKKERPMKTGQDVKIDGLYVCECCNIEMELAKDASFPRCSRCLSLSIWELAEEVHQAAA